MLLLHFQYFCYSSINGTFVRNLMEKRFRSLRRIFQGLPKFYYLTKFCYLATLDGKMTVQCFSKFRKILLATWKLKVNFSNLYNIRYWHVIHSKLSIFFKREYSIQKNRLLKGHTENVEPNGTIPYAIATL